MCGEWDNAVAHGRFPSLREDAPAASPLAAHLPLALRHVAALVGLLDQAVRDRMRAIIGSPSPE